MPTVILLNWGGVLGWIGIHAFGGAIGGVIGVGLILSLAARSVLIK
jgi:hypothetical protein